MKNTTLILALAGVTALTATAQDKPKPQALLLQAAPGVARPAIFRGPQLDLTEEQQKKLQQIRQDYSKKIRALYQNKELTREDRADQAKDLREDLQKSTEGVYTKEQKAKLAKFKEEQAKRLEELRKNRPANGIRPRIQLDEKQQAALKKLRQDQAKKFQAVRELPQEERAAEYRKLSQEFQKAYQELLTDEQKKQLKARPLGRPNIRILPGGAGGAGGIRILPAPGGLRPGLQEVKPRLIKPRPKKDN